MNKAKIILVIISILAASSISTAFAVSGTNIIFKTFDGMSSHEVMRITSDQKVGVGTSSPNGPLDVRGDVLVGNIPMRSFPGSNSLYVANDAGDTHNNFRIDGDGNNLFIVADSLAGSTAGTGIIFATSTAGVGAGDKVKIDQSGNVGIGTDTPQSKLDVESSASNLATFSSSSDAANITINANTVDATTSAHLSFAIGNAPKWDIGLSTVGSNYDYDIYNPNTGTDSLLIDETTDNVAVGTSMNLDDLGTNSGSTDLTFGHGSGEGIGSKRTSGGNQNGLDFYTDFANRMSITNGGNVGIGTSSPSTEFQLNAGDISDKGAGNGVILKSSGGTCVKITATDAGGITWASVMCPS